MIRDLKKEVFYPHPPQRVWQVLTNRRALAAWLMENDFEPRVGHKFRFQDSTLPGLDESIDCEVIELDEPKRLSYTWQDKFMPKPSIVTWVLEPQEGGTQLRLEHRILETTVTKSPKPSQGEFMQEQTTTSALYGKSLALQTKSPSALQTRTLIKTSGEHQLLSSWSIGMEFQASTSVILTSYLSSRWEYKLEHVLPQVLVQGK
ncbi:SRPBCC domain-containing protein [Brasilonema sp. UFV-L1]|uniref:SRPBCC family protein n=1 Tax=Brasilonema sp. UFV-L1 TaxID=2234130 RepID=UPI00145EBD6D|nr:SRPBCC domain-containing protein [Brasilonema sp. UFV-L1]NMG09919.1 SRPBCC domain-containing protein [Brasilonema sp. UFV-L1]